jgi:hypothetical protein
MSAVDFSDYVTGFNVQNHGEDKDLLSSHKGAT